MQGNGNRSDTDKGAIINQLNIIIMEVREIELKFKKSKKSDLKSDVAITSPTVAIDFFKNQLGFSIDLYESVLVMYLNQANKVIGWQKISQGGIAGTVVDVRLIMATALKSLATGMIICHNHPSGNMTSSRQDDNMTEKLKQACEYFDINLLDHIIISSSDKHYSYRDEGKL